MARTVSGLQALQVQPVERKGSSRGTHWSVGQGQGCVASSGHSSPWASPVVGRTSAFPVLRPRKDQPGSTSSPKGCHPKSLLGPSATVHDPHPMSLTLASPPKQDSPGLSPVS